MKMIRVFTITLICLFQLLISESAYASSGKSYKVTGIYSSLAFNKESGDVLGDELMIVFSRDGYYVVFQYSEGEPSPPIVIPAKISGHILKFKLPPEFFDRGEFIGEISRYGLSGKFEKSDQILKLKRKNSYWQ